MKKIFLLICFLVFAQTVSAQTIFASKKLTDSLRTELERTNNPAKRFYILNRISDIKNFQAEKIDSAITVEMLHIAEHLENDSLLAVCYNLVGLYFFNKGDNNTSLEYLIKGIPLAEKVNDKRRISSLYFDISMVYFNLYSYEEAFKNIIKGGENLPDKSYPFYDYMLVQYQRNMTMYFIFTNQTDSALKYAQELLETSNRIKSILFKYASMYLNGSVYNMMGNNEQAEIYFNKAISISDSIISQEEKLKFYESYIEYLIKNNKTNEALEQAKQLMNLANQSNDVNLKLSGSGYLSQVYDIMNNTDSAYHYSKMEKQISEEIFSQRNLDKIQALAFDEKIRVMEEDAKKNEEQKKRNIQIQYLFLAIIIITLVVLYMLFSHRLISNPQRVEYFGILALLIVFEFVNLILHPVLGELTHHRPLLMLLGLVSIAAFLVPLHHKGEKWVKEYLTKKNERIRIEKAEKKEE